MRAEIDEFCLWKIFQKFSSIAKKKKKKKKRNCNIAELIACGSALMQVVNTADVLLLVLRYGYCIRDHTCCATSAGVVMPFAPIAPVRTSWDVTVRFRIISVPFTKPGDIVWQRIFLGSISLAKTSVYRDNAALEAE